jgi:hypothetical protein
MIVHVGSEIGVLVQVSLSFIVIQSDSKTVDVEFELAIFHLVKSTCSLICRFCC